MKYATAILMIVFAASARAAVLEGPIVNPANGNEYYLISTPSWTAAEAEAVALGGHLVTIRSAEENAWVFGTIVAGRAFNPWIGFNDAAVEGTFVWSSGEPVTYTNWKPGEPNNLGGEDYARFDFGPGWNDVPSTSHNTEHGIVEIVIPSPDTDSDGVVDDFDNCPDDFNPAQEDMDGDGVGDLCNDAIDADGDEYADNLDSCPDHFNPDQADTDGDGIGDLCDAFPADPNNAFAQCFSDLGDCQIDVISCESGAAQCSIELSQSQAAVITCNGNLSSCIGTATQLEADLAQTQADLSQAQTDLSQAEADITQLQSDLAACLSVGPECADGFDNDSDGTVDYPADADCLSPTDDTEAPPSSGCGIGPELALLFPALLALRQRRRES